MIVRAARPEDAETAAIVLRRSICELCRADHQDDPKTLELWLSNKTPAHVRAWIADPEVRLLVAEDEHGILGVAAMQATGRISLNYVSPDARLRGVSKALLTELERHARALGLRTVALESTRTASAFYRAMGYTQIGEPQAGFGVSVCIPMRKGLCKTA